MYTKICCKFLCYSLNLQKLFKMRLSVFCEQLMHFNTILQVGWHNFILPSKFKKRECFQLNDCWVSLLICTNNVPAWSVFNKLYDKMSVVSQWGVILTTFRAQCFNLEFMKAKLGAYAELQRIHCNLSVKPRIM
jgi:hypothetical protein